MAHPVRPDEYQEINNFYTATVYEKGAEVIRMQHTLLGPAAFRRGMDLYFERHDGQAVTCDDFVQSMQDASGLDLTQFKRWYSQAGTPLVRLAGRYDEAAKTYTLEVAQEASPSPGQRAKEPYHIPLAIGLLGQDGADLPLRVEGDARSTDDARARRALAAPAVPLHRRAVARRCRRCFAAFPRRCGSTSPIPTASSRSSPRTTAIR